MFLLSTLKMTIKTYALTNKKPVIKWVQKNEVNSELIITHAQMGDYSFYFQNATTVLFTENETNTERLYQRLNETPFVKDAFHDAVLRSDFKLFANKKSGTKCSPVFSFSIEPAGSVTIKLRLSKNSLEEPLGKGFDEVFTKRLMEADDFYNHLIKSKNDDLKNIQRQAFAGMLWNKQFYHIDIPNWLNGDPNGPPSSEQRKHGRNSEWPTLNNEDILSVPDKWEYPWYAGWDLAFHCIPLALLDADFAKRQLELLTREWYMHPNGQLPAYEWSFSDVNPPVHAWATWRVYKIDAKQSGKADREFLEGIFHKLLLNFTWWVNRKDEAGRNVFQGGFLGLDNISVFDRSEQLPTSGHIDQADGTSWMAMYALNLLRIALELASHNRVYEDIATKFFE